MLGIKFKKKQKKTKLSKVDTTALIYALKTVRIRREDLLGMNNHALSILNIILSNENALASEISVVENKGENLYASIQIVLEAADVLTEYTKETGSKIKLGIVEINAIIDKISLFTETTSNILSFIQPFKDYSVKIGSISDIIFSIAEMTESAARNAGIKAYHAGEFGRGFEVIADRMLMLANKTFVLTQKIPVGINKIQQYTEDIINNINKTENFAKEMAANIENLGDNLKNIDDNITSVTKTSDKIKGFVSLQDKNKNNISRLNREAIGLIKKSVESGERLSSMVTTQSDIKMMLLYHMEQIDDMISILQSDRDDLNPAISNEIKLFNKVENQLINSKNISEQLIGIISDFIDFNESQIVFIGGYKKNIIELEDNERMIENNIQDLDDNISLMSHAVNKFNENIEDTSSKIQQVEIQIKELMEIFKNVSNNLLYIQKTSDELKELSDQTKLLSLYASIESARAGKYQKSLSVIVTQSKELILKASQASSEINKIIKNMQSVIDSINDIVNSELETSVEISESIVNGKRINSQIDDITVNIRNLIKEIYNSLESQSNVRNDIIETYNKINAETETINDRIKELNSVFKQDLAKNEENLKMTKGIKDSINSKFSITNDYKNNVYRMIVSNTPQHWVPSLVGDASSNYILQMIHSGLVKLGRDTNVLPSVAKHWYINEDATEWIFYLRDNVYFHDGSKLTAEDVKASFYRTMHSPNATFINMIKGSQAYIKKKNHYIDGIQILDDYTIKFVLDYPYIPFLSNLAITPLSIVKKEMMLFNDKKMMENPIGCGPFIVDEFNGKIIKLKANKNHYDGEPYIDMLDITFTETTETFNMLIEDKIDFCNLSGDDYNNLTREHKVGINVTSLASLDMQYIGFNMRKKNELSLNKKVRQAISHATDKIRYINESMSGGAIVGKGIFPPSLSAYNNSLVGYDFDLAKAKQLMTEAGFPNGIDRTFDVLCSGSENVLKRANLIKEMWGEIGIRLNLLPQPWADLLRKMHSGDSEIYMMGWAGDTGEPDNFLYPLFHTDSFGDGGNTTYYSNPEVDAMILIARQTTDPDKRNSIYRKVEEIIVDDAPMVFLSHNYNRIGLRDRVKGYYIHPLHLYPLDITWLDWREDGS